MYTRTCKSAGRALQPLRLKRGPVVHRGRLNPPIDGYVIHLHRGALAVAEQAQALRLMAGLRDGEG